MPRVSLFSSLLILTLILGALVVCPEIDIFVSSLFVSPNQGFFLRDNVFLNGLTKFVFYGSRILFVVLAAVLGIVTMRRKPIGGLTGRASFFLLLALLVGPGLVANVVLKDHWGRARPRDVEIFGGSKIFTPAAVLSHACERNCSFVSGDASFGFFLTSVAYVVPVRRRRIVFWSAMGVGSLFAGARIVMGAHFFSDVVFACVLVLAISAGLHALLFGKKETASCWKEWLRLGYK